MPKRTFHKDIDWLMEKRLISGQVAEVKDEIQEEILRIRLSDPRRQVNVTQVQTISQLAAL